MLYSFIGYEHKGLGGERMKCKDCKYYSLVDGTIFCDSRNNKRRTVRISKEDAEKDMKCKWADKESEGI